jgi:predicted RNase H-like HicB family nuclease
MATLDIHFWQEGRHWLGYIAKYPHYITQGDTLEDLREHLLDLRSEILHGHLPVGF